MIEIEREHILSVLSLCNWKIHGQGGAAELLELNASTLNSRMKKLGIEKNYYKPGENWPPQIDIHLNELNLNFIIYQKAENEK